jgi:hypothetical protein
MRRLLQATLILLLLCCAASGCGEPGYGYYGDRGYRFAPTRMDGLSTLEATHQFSSTTILGRTITSAAATIRRLAVVTSEASAAGIAERGC